MQIPLELPPFRKNQQLCNDLDQYNPKAAINVILPGQPLLNFNDIAGVNLFLEKEFWANDLEIMAPHLWAMTTQSSAHVNPLHRQRVKGREIVVTEEPRLHLVWWHDRIFVKPLPRYLLSYAFWETFLIHRSTVVDDHQNTIRSAALGYMRTYRYLIQHESDFRIAQQDHLRLIPQDVSWEDFCRFISGFDCIKDSDVSPRYCYGEMRLSRLNLYAPLFLHRFRFEKTHGQYSDYFARFFGPTLFFFAIVSTFLNSMQVGLAVEQLSSKHWVALWSVSRWFSAVSLVATGLIVACFVLLWIWMFLDEWIFAIKDKLRKRHERHQNQHC